MEKSEWKSQWIATLIKWKDLSSCEIYPIWRHKTHWQIHILQLQMLNDKLPPTAEQLALNSNNGKRWRWFRSNIKITVCRANDACSRCGYRVKAYLLTQNEPLRTATLSAQMKQRRETAALKYRRRAAAKVGGEENWLPRSGSKQGSIRSPKTNADRIWQDSWFLSTPSLSLCLTMAVENVFFSKLGVLHSPSTRRHTQTSYKFLTECLKHSSWQEARLHNCGLTTTWY